MSLESLAVTPLRAEYNVPITGRHLRHEECIAVDKHQSYHWDASAASQESYSPSLSANMSSALILFFCVDGARFTTASGGAGIAVSSDPP